MANDPFSIVKAVGQSGKRSFSRGYQAGERFSERMEERRQEKQALARAIADDDIDAKKEIAQAQARRKMEPWITAFSVSLLTVLFILVVTGGLGDIGIFALFVLVTSGLRIYFLRQKMLRTIHGTPEQSSAGGWKLSLPRARKAEEEKQEIINTYIPLLNEYREALLGNGLDNLSPETLAIIEPRVNALYKLLKKAGVSADSTPEEVVSNYSLSAEWYRQQPAKEVKAFFEEEFPRDILGKPNLRLSASWFRKIIEETRTLIEKDIQAQLANMELTTYGFEKPIPGVADLGLKPNLPVGFYTFDKERFKHAYIIGKTGFGKSTLLANLILQDIHYDANVVVLSHERDFFKRLLSRFPEHRADDLIYFDPSDITPPIIGFNPFRLEPGEDVNFKAGEVYTTLERAIGDMGTSMRTLFNNAVHALLELPDTTILDLERLLDPEDASLRKRVVSHKDIEPRTRRFWEKYQESSYYQASTDPVMNRLDAFFRKPLAITLTNRSFSFAEQLNNNARVLFCDLSGLRGFTVDMMGQLLIAQLQQTFFARDKMEQYTYPETFVYIDEFQRYAAKSETAIIEMFNGLRKYFVGIHLAHQTTANLSNELRATILGNVSTIAVLRVAAQEASYFAKELQLFEITEKRSPPGRTKIEELEVALELEHRRLEKLGAPSSNLAESLERDIKREWLRQQKESLLGRDPEGEEDEEPETRLKLRPDILQNLEIGRAIVRLPGFQGCVSIKVSEEPPIASPKIYRPDAEDEERMLDLISRSKQNFGFKETEAPIPSEDSGGVAEKQQPKAKKTWKRTVKRAA